MARDDHLPPAALDVVDYIQQTRDSYASLGYDDYRWADNPEAVPLAVPSKPLSECKLAVIASGGVYEAGQVAFTHKDDVSYRRIATDVDVDDLRVSHFAFDLTDSRHDPNVIFPIEALRTMVAQGELGSLTSHGLTFMGGIYSQRRLREVLMPQLISQVTEMAADIVLLVPV